MAFAAATLAGKATTAQLATTAFYGSVATTAIGTYTQMKGAAAAAKSEAAIYQYNARVAEIQAKQQQRASLAEQRIQREQTQKLLKKQRALFAKGKVQMTGSPLEVQLEAAEIMAEDIGTIAYERRLGVARSITRGRIETFKAGAAKQAGKIAVGTALFGGLSQTAQLGLAYQLNK